MKKCEKEIPEQYKMIQGEMGRVAPQLFVSEYLVLTGKKKGDYNMRVSLLRKNTFFFPQNHE